MAKYTHEEMIEKYGWDVAYPDHPEADEMREQLLKLFGTRHVGEISWASRSPLTNNLDPLAVDSRPCRLLTEQEEVVVSIQAQKGWYASTAGFEMFRGSDRWMYTDILGFYPTAEAVPEDEMPVGPVDEDFIKGLRFFGDANNLPIQMAIRMLDPCGKPPTPPSYNEDEFDPPINMGIGGEPETDYIDPEW